MRKPCQSTSNLTHQNVKGVNCRPIKKREQIRAEEIFRAEVQRELKSPQEQSLKAKTWRFFNTALGLWVLSSLVLGGITAGFGYLQNHLAAVRRNQVVVDRDSEQIAVRLEYSQLFLKAALDSEAKSNANPIDVKRSIYQSGLRAFLEDTSETRLFPESKDRSTLSLVFELKAKDKTMPETGDHSYRVMLDHVSELMELRNKLNSPSYANLSEKERLQLFTSIDTALHEIDLM